MNRLSSARFAKASSGMGEEATVVLAAGVGESLFGATEFGVQLCSQMRVELFFSLAAEFSGRVGLGVCGCHGNHLLPERVGGARGRFSDF